MFSTRSWTALVASLSLFSSAFALSVVTPIKDQSVLGGSDLTVTWSRVGTDPTDGHIILTNQGSYPTYRLDYGSVSLDQQSSFTFKLCSDLVQSGQYQVNIEANNGGILAQSQQFSISPNTASGAGYVACSPGVAPALTAGSSSSSSTDSASLTSVVSTQTASTVSTVTSRSSTSTSIRVPTGSSSATSTRATASSSTTKTANAGPTMGSNAKMGLGLGVLAGVLIL